MGRIKDGDWTLIDHDLHTGVSVWGLYDGQRMVFRTDYPVANLVKQNRVERNEAQGWKGDWHKVASTPANLFYASGMAEAHDQQDHAFINRWLDENSAFRVKEGRI